MMAFFKKLKPIYLVLAAAFFAYLSFDYVKRYSEDGINKHLVIGLVFGIGVIIKASELYNFFINRKSEQFESKL